MAGGGVRRFAIVGTGDRATMYTKALAARPQTQLVALCDPNKTRMGYHQKLIAAAGAPAATEWAPEQFATMVDKESVDTVVVTTPDFLHWRYTVDALDAGRQVITEKAMCVDAAQANQVLAATRRHGRHITVTFNYRFSPLASTVHRLLAEGVVGQVVSVHFEWLLDVTHGADYFHRWHREKPKSGGLMLHKASHHFDLVNWLLGVPPEWVVGLGRLAFYGRENGIRTGYRRDYERAHGAPAAADDPFAIDLSANPELSGLYLDAEHEDGYFRDRNVFGDGISIEDDMALLVRYAGGIAMTYHLTAYSPWEGYRMAFNGTKGRLEVEHVARAWQHHAAGAAAALGVHGADEAVRPEGEHITVRPLWDAPYPVPVPARAGGHGGADAGLLDMLFGTTDGGRPDTDYTAWHADETDGARAVGIGAAANISFTTGKPVTITDIIDL